jgi:integrase
VAVRSNRSYFNSNIWKPALRGAGVPVTRANGMHALRHFFASALLDGGESIRAVSEYLGHADPGSTLRTYTHLMPSSAERTRKAIDAVFASAGAPADGASMAQVGD